jgi:hypothetical protein
MDNMELTVDDIATMSLYEIIGKLHDRDGELYTIINNMPDGKSGQSAYELAVTDGFVGSVTDWLSSLKGDAGAKGDAGESTVVYYETLVNDLLTKEEFIRALADNVESGLIVIRGNISYKRENKIGFKKHNSKFLFKNKSKVVSIDGSMPIIELSRDNTIMRIQ